MPRYIAILLTLIRAIAKCNFIKIGNQISMAANLTPIVAHGNWDDFIFTVVAGGGLAIFIAVYLIMLAIVYLVSKRSLVKVSNIKVKALYVTVIGLIIYNLIVFIFELDQLSPGLWLISFATKSYVAILLFLILLVNLYILVSKRSLVKVSDIKVKALYVTVIALIIYNLIVFVFELDQLSNELWLISFVTKPYVAILLFLILFVNLYIKLWPKFNPPPTQQPSPSKKDEIEK